MFLSMERPVPPYVVTYAASLAALFAVDTAVVLLVKAYLLLL